MAIRRRGGRGGRGRSGSPRLLSQLRDGAALGVRELRPLERLSGLPERIELGQAIGERGQRLVLVSASSDRADLIGWAHIAQALSLGDGAPPEILIGAPAFLPFTRRGAARAAAEGAPVHLLALPELAGDDSAAAVLESHPDLTVGGRSPLVRSLADRVLRVLEGACALSGTGVLRQLPGGSRALYMRGALVARILATGDGVVVQFQEPDRRQLAIHDGNFPRLGPELHELILERAQDPRLIDGPAAAREAAVRSAAQAAHAQVTAYVLAWSRDGADPIEWVGIDPSGRPILGVVRESLVLRDVPGLLAAVQRFEEEREVWAPGSRGRPRLLASVDDLESRARSLLTALGLEVQVRGTDLAAAAARPADLAEGADDGERRGRRRGRRRRRGRGEEGWERDGEERGARASSGEDAEAERPERDADADAFSARDEDTEEGDEVAGDEVAGDSGREYRERGRRGRGRGRGRRGGWREASAEESPADSDASSGAERSPTEDADAAESPFAARGAADPGGDTRGNVPPAFGSARATGDAPEDSEARQSADDADDADDDSLDTDRTQVGLESEVAATLAEEEPEAEESEEEPQPEEPKRPRRLRAAIVVRDDPDAVLAALILARDRRHVVQFWVCPQESLMDYFKTGATDLPDNCDICLVGFTAEPVPHEVLATAELYRGRLIWFDHHDWPIEDVERLREAIGRDSIVFSPDSASVLAAVMSVAERRSRLTDKLVDLSGRRLGEGDMEKWGDRVIALVRRLAAARGDQRNEINPLLSGKPAELPEAPDVFAAEQAWLEEREPRLVYFGEYAMGVVHVPAELDAGEVARRMRLRTGARLSLASREGDPIVSLGCNEEKRHVNVVGLVEQLGDRLPWLEAKTGGDRVGRVLVEDLPRHPERIDMLIGEIVRSKSILYG